MGFQGPPAVDFYSMLSGLGDTIQKNRQEQAKKDAFAAATTPGADGKIDFGRAILGLAQVDPQSANILAARQNHEDTLKQQAIDTARAAANDKFNHSIQSENLAINRARANREAADFENTPDQYAPNPKFGQPGEPQYIDQYAQATAAASAGKPIPVETLGGTKFMVRGPSGYSLVDPSSLSQPQPAVQPQPQPGGAGPAPVPPPEAPQASVPAAPPQDLTAVDPTTGRREAWLKSQSPDVQAYIKKIADYEVDPRTTSIKGGHREQVMSAVAQYDPTYDQNNFGSRAKAIRDFATGTQGNAVRSFDVAIDHLDTLQKYSDALKSGDTRLINSLRNKWLTETGSALPTNVQAVAPIVGAEVSKAIIGSNNALADREELRKPLQIANSPEQISGAIQGYKGLMAGQLKGLKKQYEDTTGKKDFDNRVREATRTALLGEGGPAASKDASSNQNVTSSGVKWSIQ